MKCENCGLPDDRKSLCDRWDCAVNTRPKFITMDELTDPNGNYKTIRFIAVERDNTALRWFPLKANAAYGGLARDHAPDCTRTISVSKPRRWDDTRPDPELVPDLRWPFSLAGLGLRVEND